MNVPTRLPRGHRHDWLMRLVAAVTGGMLLSACAAHVSVRIAASAGNTAVASGGSVVPAQSVATTAVGLINATPRGGTVDLEIYELGNPSVIAALEAAQRRAVTVRVILDATERQSEISGPALRRAGVAVETMRVPGGIDHVKLLVADGRVLMGGVNLGTGSSYTTDMDVELPGWDVTEAVTVFNTDWQSAGVDSPVASGAFGPFVTGKAIEAALLRVISGAGKGTTCFVVANYLSDWTVRDALVAAARRGASLDVLLNPTAYGVHRADAALVAGGAHVAMAPRSPYLHAKVLACETGGAWNAVAGSANFSYDGMTVNHELDVVLSGDTASHVGVWAEGAWPKAGTPA